MTLPHTKSETTPFQVTLADRKIVNMIESDYHVSIFKHMVRFKTTITNNLLRLEYFNAPDKVITV